MKAKMKKEDLARLEAYLKKTFGTKNLTVRSKKDDFAEVFVGEEFVATITIDDEDGELAFQFQMAILELDLQEV